MQSHGATSSHASPHIGLRCRQCYSLIPSLQGRLIQGCFPCFFQVISAGRKHAREDPFRACSGGARRLYNVPPTPWDPTPRLTFLPFPRATPSSGWWNNGDRASKSWSTPESPSAERRYLWLHLDSSFGVWNLGPRRPSGTRTKQNEGAQPQTADLAGGQGRTGSPRAGREEE